MFRRLSSVYSKYLVYTEKLKTNYNFRLLSVATVFLAWDIEKTYINETMVCYEKDKNFDSTFFQKHVVVPLNQNDNISLYQVVFFGIHYNTWRCLPVVYGLLGKTIMSIGVLIFSTFIVLELSRYFNRSLRILEESTMKRSLTKEEKQK